MTRDRLLRVALGATFVVHFATEMLLSLYVFIDARSATSGCAYGPHIGCPWLIKIRP